MQPSDFSEIEEIRGWWNPMLVYEQFNLVTTLCQKTTGYIRVSSVSVSRIPFHTPHFHSMHLRILKYDAICLWYKMRWKSNSASCHLWYNVRVYHCVPMDFHSGRYNDQSWKPLTHAMRVTKLSRVGESNSSDKKIPIQVIILYHKQSTSYIQSCRANLIKWWEWPWKYTQWYG